eukprot:664687-Pelagomonas_calceolata.AAC.1
MISISENLGINNDDPIYLVHEKQNISVYRGTIYRHMYLHYLARCNNLARLVRAASYHDGLVGRALPSGAQPACLPITATSITLSSHASGISQKQLWPWPSSLLTVAGFSKK